MNRSATPDRDATRGRCAQRLPAGVPFATGVLALLFASAALPARAQTPMPPGNSAFVPFDAGAQAEVRLVRDYLDRRRWPEALRHASAALRAAGPGGSEPVVEDPGEPGLCRGLLECLLALRRGLSARDARDLEVFSDAAASAAFAQASALCDPAALAEFARAHPFSGRRDRALLLAADRYLETGRFLEAEGCLEAAARGGRGPARDEFERRLAFARERLGADGPPAPAPFRGFRFVAEKRLLDAPAGAFASDRLGPPPAEAPASSGGCVLFSTPGTVDAFFPATGESFRWRPFVRTESAGARRHRSSWDAGPALLHRTVPAAQEVAERGTGFCVAWGNESGESAARAFPALAGFRLRGPSTAPEILWSRPAPEAAGGRDPALHAGPVSRGGRVWVGSWESDPPPSRIALSCLDGATGRRLWTRFVCAPEGDRRHPGAPADARQIPDHGELLLAGGLVVIQTNAGVLAAFDALDGALAWLVQYPRMPGAFERAPSRPLAAIGAVEEPPPVPLHFGPPLRIGGWVVFAPWDSRCVQAVPLSGAPPSLVWNASVGTTGTSLASLAGRSGRLLVLGLDDRFLALDAERRWAPAWMLAGARAGTGVFQGAPSGPGAFGESAAILPTTRGLWAADPSAGRLLEGENASFPFGWRGAGRVGLYAAGGRLVALTEDRLLLFELE